MQNLPKKVRSKKLNSRVDLTAMVSVSFLLIIFFMVVGELSKSKGLDLYTGSDCDDCGVYRHEGENRSITIMLGENNRLIYYVGLIANPIIKPKSVAYGKNGIRKELMTRLISLQKYSKGSNKRRYNDVVVIIKPTKKSTYGNLVDILDEMKITGITSYFIVPEFTPEETKLIASN